MGGTKLALDDTLQARLRTLGPQLKTLELSPNSTIVPAELSDTDGRRALGLLQPIRTVRDDVELKETLGEGGMGIVYSAIQRSLGRNVAIKALRPEHRREQDVLTLLREAWVTGSLEHPNILPIYDVKLDDERMPLVVLKRIEGVDWGESMHDAGELEERLGQGEPLILNLKVFMQVCHAIAFAHSRGIVHRDIKPDNVRIGAFGEVYVLDWGIAVALHDDGTGRFPLAKNATGMAGTPSYMAPEMLGDGSGVPINERTDIYLLGATLCEIATGYPPHDGPTAEALVASVIQSAPRLDDVPRELAEIIRRCMAPLPEERFASADDVRTAIQHFLDHRVSDQLATGAGESLDQLATLVASGHDDVRVAAHDLLGACRAGFTAALDVWSDNDAAKRGLRESIELMADYELRRGDARAAADLLTQVDEPSKVIARRVARGLDLQRESEARRIELEALGKDLDPNTGTRTRMLTAVAVGTVWCLLPLGGPLLNLPNTYTLQVGMGTAAIVTATWIFVWGRESLSKTAYNRRLSGTVMLVLSAMLLLLLGGYLGGIDPDIIATMYLFDWALATGLVALALEPKLWPSAFIYAIAFLAAARWPDKRYHWMSLSNAFVTLNFAVAWRPRADDAQPTPPSSVG